MTMDKSGQCVRILDPQTRYSHVKILFLGSYWLSTDVLNVLRNEHHVAVSSNEAV